MRRALGLVVIIAVLASGAWYFLLGRRAVELTGVVQTETGAVRGAWTEDAGVALFAGLPYASPPVGALRWWSPQPHPPWEHDRDAIQFGPECLQNRAGVDAVLRELATGLGFGWLKERLVLLAMRLRPAPKESEDCLYLNVRTGNLGGADPRPAMVWIHGGGFVNGAGSDPPFQSNALVKRGVVLATLNYRLGPFGFFAHPALTAEGAQSGSGNFGLLDQIAALRWVQNNIAAFGGDMRARCRRRISATTPTG